MKKNYLFLFLAVLFFNGVHAQDEAVTSVQKNQFKINMLFPGFVYEHGFSAKNTLYSEIALGLGYAYNSYHNDGNLYIVPLISEQFRHYYNLEKRAAKGKRTAFNSGNYLAGNAVYNFRSISTNDEYGDYVPSFTVAALWGLQRTYKGRFNLEFNIGPGVNFDKYDTEFVPVGNFTLGWVLGK
jgi:putative salt-induced outer membrane protein YdiY